MKRRDFIKKSSAVVATTVVGTSLASCGGGSTTAGKAAATGAVDSGTKKPGNSATISKTLYITDGLITMTEADPANARDVYFRGFSSTDAELNVPGESLIVNQGDTIEMTIVNTLQSTHRFYIAGLNVDSGPIAPGAQAIFTFTADTAGTFFYEDPTELNRLIGMHGGFAVMPSGSKNELFTGSRDFVQQLIWIFNDVDYNWNAAVANKTTVPSSFVPQYFTLNGLSGKPPAPPGNGQPSPDYGNPAKDAVHDPRTMLVGGLGDRTLIRVINVGMAKHSMHIHANHLEWLSQDGTKVPGSLKSDPFPFEKDVIPLNRQGGICDVIYPFGPPPDAVPKFTQQTIVDAEAENRKIAYPMHLHDEMTQTANGGSYMYGAMTDIFYKSYSVTTKKSV